MGEQRTLEVWEKELIDLVRDTEDFDNFKERHSERWKEAVSIFVKNTSEREAIFSQIQKDVKAVARLYLKNLPKHRMKKIAFSSYFSWFVAQRINKNPELKKDLGK